MSDKLYRVEISTTVVVAGADADDAYERACDELHNIRDEAEFDVRVGQTLNQYNVPEPWDEDCVPYGGDGNTRIKDYVAT